MRKAVLFFIFLSICFPNYCQVISGTVFDLKTKKQIPFANVFFNSSTFGTQTDEFGNFKLIMPNNQKLPIAVSLIGYDSELITEYSTESSLKIYLSPKIYNLDEVYVISKKSAAENKRRQQNINMFKTQFLGTSSYAKSCEILNEEDIFLQYSEENDLLRASCQKPLIIYNKALGYQVTYYMNKFEYSPKHRSLSFMGTFIFKEDQKINALKKIIVEYRRRQAYVGSQMQFFRSLWQNNLKADKYEIRSYDDKKLTYENLVVQPDSITKYLKFRGTVTVYNYSKMTGTLIQLQKDSLFFDRLGYYDPLGLNWYWGSEMANQRMGDQLPFDYDVKKRLTKN